MLDAACAGAVFTSPTPEQMLGATKAVDGGAGVFYVASTTRATSSTSRWPGELAEAEGVQTDYVVTNDDVAVEDSTYTSGRRGITGTIFVHKICGAAADDGRDLAGVKARREVNANVRSMGMALTSCIPPESGEAIFDIGEDEMEIGIGIHGEPGVERKKIEPADQIVDELPGGSWAIPWISAAARSPSWSTAWAARLMELYIAYAHVPKSSHETPRERLQDAGRRGLHDLVGDGRLHHVVAQARRRDEGVSRSAVRGQAGRSI